MTRECKYLYIHPSTISFGVPRISEEKQESQMGYFAVPERDLCSENFVHFHIMDFLWSCHLPLFVFFYIINNHLLPYFFARLEDVEHCPKKCKCASCNYRFHRINHISRPNKAYMVVYCSSSSIVSI